MPSNEPPRIIGYDARNSVQVRVGGLGEMAMILYPLVGAGANEVNGPSFTLDDQKAALDEFASARRVGILSLPTGQGLLLKP